MRRAALCLVTALYLWGCSSPTVIHLHPEDLAPPQVASITEELVHEGFAVEIEDNEAPTTGNTIIYSPHKNIEQQLNSIMNVLEDHDLAVDQIFLKDSGGEQSEGLGTHSYTAGHIGVYLAGDKIRTVPRGVKIRSTFPIDMIGYEFVSRNCDVDYIYEFFESGDVVVANVRSLTEEFKEHTWYEKEGSVVIHSTTGPQYKYIKSEDHSVYQNSELDNEVVAYTIELSPAGFYPLPYGCSYMATFKEAFGR